MIEDKKKAASWWKYILVCCVIFIAIRVYLDKKRENDRAMSMIENITTSVLPRKESNGIDSASLQQMLKDAEDKGYTNGFDRGQDAGFRHGEKEAQKRIAIKALIEDVSCEVVSRIADLDLEAVKYLEKTHTSKPIEPIIQNKNNADKEDHIDNNDNRVTNTAIPAYESKAKDIEQREEEE